MSGILHTFKKKGDFDNLRKQIYSAFSNDTSQKATLTDALSTLVDSELEKNPNLLSKDRRQAAPLVEGAAERTGVYKVAESDVDRLIDGFLDGAGQKLREIRRSDVGHDAAADEERKGSKTDEEYTAEAQARRQERAKIREEQLRIQKEKEEEERKRVEEHRRKIREEAEQRERERKEAEEKRRQEREAERQQELEHRREWEREMEERRERKARQDAEWERERLLQEERARQEREEQREENIEQTAMRELLEEGKRLAGNNTHSRPMASGTASPRKFSDAGGRALPKESALEAIMRKEKLERERAKAEAKRSNQVSHELTSPHPPSPYLRGNGREREKERRDSAPVFEYHSSSRPPYSFRAATAGTPQRDASQSASSRFDNPGFYGEKHSQPYPEQPARYHYDEAYFYSQSRNRRNLEAYEKYEKLSEYDYDRREHRHTSGFYEDRLDPSYDEYYKHKSSKATPPEYQRSSRDPYYHSTTSSTTKHDLPLPPPSRSVHRKYEYDYAPEETQSLGRAPNHHEVRAHKPQPERSNNPPPEIDRYIPATSTRRMDESTRTKIFDRSQLDEKQTGKAKGDPESFKTTEDGDAIKQGEPQREPGKSKDPHPDEGDKGPEGPQPKGTKGRRYSSPRDEDHDGEGQQRYREHRHRREDSKERRRRREEREDHHHRHHHHHDRERKGERRDKVEIDRYMPATSSRRREIRERAEKDRDGTEAGGNPGPEAGGTSQ